MQTLTLTSNMNRSKDNTPIPVTGRGRALYTIDWFINGKPVLANRI